MTTQHVHRLPFGAQPGDDGRVRFRLWAPDAADVALEIEGQAPAADDGGAGGLVRGHPPGRSGRALQVSRETGFRRSGPGVALPGGRRA